MQDKILIIVVLMRQVSRPYLHASLLYMLYTTRGILFQFGHFIFVISLVWS